MAGDVCQSFLRDTEQGVERPRREGVVGWQLAVGELDRGARSKPEGVALLLHGFHEADVSERGGLQLVEHDLHLDHGLPRRGPDLIHRLYGAGGVVVETRLSRGRGRLDDEDLLLDRVVEVARETVALFLRGRRPNLLLVGRAEHSRRKFAPIAEDRLVVGRPPSPGHFVNGPGRVPEHDHRQD